VSVLVLNQDLLCTFFCLAGKSKWNDVSPWVSLHQDGLSKPYY